METFGRTGWLGQETGHNKHNKRPATTKLHSHTLSDFNQPPSRFHGDSPQLRFVAETSRDFVQSGRVNSRWQIAIRSERWNHFGGSFDGGSGFHSRANCSARCRTASLIVWSEEMALSHSDCGLSWARRK